MNRRAVTLPETVVVIAVLGLLLGLLLTGVQRVRDAAARLSCSNNLRQLGMALHGYHDTRQSFPPAVSHLPGGTYGPDLDPYPLLNWHARLLPFVEQDGLWTQIEKEYAADPSKEGKTPPHNAATVIVRIFLCPADNPQPRPHSSTIAGTSYLGVSGLQGLHSTSGMLFLDSQVRLAEVTDGTSHTLFVAERPPTFFWPTRGHWHGGSGYWGPYDSYLGVREEIYGTIDYCPPGPYHFTTGHPNNPCSAYHYWSLHSGGANFLFADGSVRFLPYSADPLLPALATRTGGEVSPLD